MILVGVLMSTNAPEPIFISVANVKIISGMTIIWLGSALVVIGIIPLLFYGKRI